MKNSTLAVKPTSSEQGVTIPPTAMCNLMDSLESYKQDCQLSTSGTGDVDINTRITALHNLISHFFTTHARSDYKVTYETCAIDQISESKINALLKVLHDFRAAVITDCYHYGHIDTSVIDKQIEVLTTAIAFYVKPGQEEPKYESV